ncbi:ATP-binding cassette domain-containing protein, partial [Clostridioides difficile]
MENKIKINNINFSYRGNDKQLTDINLTILSGQCLAIVGKSGCGKSTLTRVINGLIPSFYQGY